MTKKSNLQFEQVKEPIDRCVSKFGGQPNWVSEPEWPIDSEKEEKMQFIGQIELIDELFGETTGQMAYIFFDGDEEGQGTWDPNGGLNAIIVQPGNNDAKTVAEATGPVAPVNEYYDGIDWDKSGLHEFKLNFEFSEEPDYLDDDAIGLLIDENEKKYDEYAEKMEVSKIGGNPFFIQGEVIPIQGNWEFLCQLFEHDLPVWVNFGTGIAYAFINEEGTNGKILWQC